MHLAYILPISPIPMIPTVMLFSVSTGIVVEDFVTEDMLLATQIRAYRLVDEVCDFRSGV